MFNFSEKNLLIIRKISNLNFVFVLTSFLILEYGFINSEFSLNLIVNNSHTTKPMIYKISGLWGNHEGSLLLWILILTLFTFLFSNNTSIPKNNFFSNILGIQNIVIFFFLLFILFLSNPFQRSSNPPLEGLGLNPLLQDPGLAFHPPLLYVGYVGLSLSFSFAVCS
jgi:Cytochrome c biogenesis factor